MNALDLFIAVSACWRLSSLVANESGPFDVFETIRRQAVRLSLRSRLFARSKLARGLLCEWCNSVWFATLIVLAWLTIGPAIRWLLLIPAISAWAILFKFVVQTLEQLRELAEHLAAIKRKETEYHALFSDHVSVHPHDGHPN